VALLITGQAGVGKTTVIRAVASGLAGARLGGFFTQEMRSQGLGGYLRQAEPVIGSLEDRERAIAGNLIDFAESQGLTVDAARAAVEESGLTMPTVHLVSNGDASAAIDRMQDTINQLQAEIDSFRRR